MLLEQTYTGLVRLDFIEKGSCENCVNCVVTTVFISSAPCRMPPHFSILRCKQQRIYLSFGVYSSTRKWRKIKVMYDCLLWEIEQNKEFLHFMEPESLLTRSKQPQLETHTNTSVPHPLILFNINPLQYYTPILYSDIKNTISNFRSSNSRLCQFRSLHSHAPCPAYHILDWSPQCYLVQNQRMKLLIIQFCPVCFEKWEFLLPLLPTNRYHEWRFIAFLLSLFKQLLP